MTISTQAGWEPRYARRAERMVASEIRELLKVVERPEIISFAGGIPDPALFHREVLSNAALAGAGLQYSPSEGYAPLR
jgi:DNA-binding transcriptional MocR family regulator